MMEIVRAHVERVEVVGLDEAYLDLEGLFSPRAAMRRLVAEIKAATRLTCSVGIGPNKLVAKVASDAEKPAGLRGADPRAGLRALRRLAARRWCPGIGPKTAARLAELGLTTLAALAARARAAARRALRPQPRARARSAARASNTTARSARRARSSPSRASGPSTATSATPASCARRSRGWPSELCESLAPSRAQRAHDRDQGSPRRLHDRHPRAHASRRRPTTPSWSAPRRCGCSTTTRRRGRCACSACASPACAAGAGATPRRRAPSRRRGVRGQLALPV